ncbi:helix-turn-helix domain-containing protein [Amycolatopsis thermophila]|uniref:AraC-like DNA-binding protein n=1 Tax=Amycolatopsis thermophila TaxID=206084 RepID=A0ABU0EPC1_9PSEU|nr:AraC family transcriptional regulator [Amycolatopsis thermophila]MDQ0377146.1 AraC-like DNA-binding protein [Amycolatopsis thermophila]
MRFAPALWDQLFGDRAMTSAVYVDATLELAHRRFVAASRRPDADYALPESLLDLARAAIAPALAPSPATTITTASRTASATRSAQYATHTALADERGTAPRPAGTPQGFPGSKQHPAARDRPAITGRRTGAHTTSNAEGATARPGPADAAQHPTAEGGGHTTNPGRPGSAPPTTQTNSDTPAPGTHPNHPRPTETNHTTNPSQQNHPEPTANTTSPNHTPTRPTQTNSDTTAPATHPNHQRPTETNHTTDPNQQNHPRPTANATSPSHTPARPRRTDSDIVAGARLAVVEQHPAAGALFTLAELLDVSPFRLSRAFTREVGVPLTRYRNRVRVGRVMERLEGGEADLGYLAADLGFADQAHLTRTVKEHVGHTPAALRRLLGP